MKTILIALALVLVSTVATAETLSQYIDRRLPREAHPTRVYLVPLNGPIGTKAKTGKAQMAKGKK